MNVIILAGGRGSRLQPWHAPKCLLPINGISMLHRIVAGVLRHGHRDDFSFTACLGYRASDITNALLHTMTTWVNFSQTPEDSAMGFRLQFAATEDKKISTSRSLILYGDELADVDITNLVYQHENKGADITFVAALGKMVGGVVDIDTCRIIDSYSQWVNIGYAVVEPQCWELLKPEDGLSDWINRCSETLNVNIFYHEGKRATVNSLADLEEAERIWK